MGNVLAADKCVRRMGALHERKLERLRRLRLDFRFRRTMGLGLLPLWKMGEGEYGMRLGLGARIGLGAIMGVVATGAGRVVQLRRLGPVTA